MFWKIYFIFYCFLIISGDILLFQKKVNFTLPADLFESVITGLSVLPLYFFVFKKEILDKKIWKFYFIIFLILEFKDVRFFYTHNTVDWKNLIGIGITLPCYFALYSYAFLNERKTKIFINKKEKNNLVCISVFNTRQDAQVISSLLESNGIKVLIKADDCGGMEPRMHLAADVKLFVDEGQFERAKEILSQT